jgi:hypothetical protein
VFLIVWHETNAPSKPDESAQAMVSSERKFGWLGQPGGQRFSKKVHNRHSNYKLPKITKNVVYFFNFIFINSNWLYTKPTKMRRRLRLVRGSAAAAQRSLEGTLPETLYVSIFAAKTGISFQDIYRLKWSRLDLIRFTLDNIWLEHLLVAHKRNKKCIYNFCRIT